MTNKFLIEVKLPNKPLEVFPEEGQTEDDFMGDERQKELNEFRENFLKEVKDKTISLMKSYLEGFEYYFIENAEEIGVESFESLEDYKISVNIKEND